MKTIEEFVSSDFRKIKISYSGGLLSTPVQTVFTQLEFLKIIKALEYAHKKNLAIHFVKLIEAIDKFENEKTDFERKLPIKTNGIRIKSWESI